jgi:RNA polymerase sporulation-specific sigma factor
MYTKKVEIPRLNTSELKKLSNKEINELFKRYQSGDEKAKEELVTSNIKLVLSILRRFHTNSDNINDMFQIGCIGLIKAIDNFDLSVGVCFSTYAVPLIIGEMRRANRDSSSIRVSRGIKDLAYKILDFKEKFFNVNGKEPTNEEISKSLNIEEYLITYALDSLKEPISIHTPIYSDAGDTIYLLDQIANKERTYDKDTLLSLKKAIDALREREKEIIYNRYIIGKTQTEISKELNISQAQVSRIESNALKTLKRLVK